MAHMIQDNMIAYKGETPWHGLGYQVPLEATGEEMLQIAKLNWKVQRRHIAMRDSQGREMLTTPLAGFRAIVREDTDEVFQVATDRYHPIQNSEIVDFFREYCEAGHATLETVGGLCGGSKIWALAKLNGGSTSKIGGVDEMRGYMMLATSHDGSLRTIGKPTSVRVVCWNTLSAAIGEKSENEFRMKHSKKFTAEVREEAKRLMGMAIQQIQEVNQVASMLSLASVDRAGQEEFVLRTVATEEQLKGLVKVDFSNLAPNRVAEGVMDAINTSPGSQLPTAYRTLWGCVNGVTWYVDHEQGRGQDTRLSSAWFGLGEQLKLRAVNVAREMAGVRVR